MWCYTLQTSMSVLAASTAVSTPVPTLMAASCAAVSLGTPYSQMGHVQVYLVHYI